MQGNSDKVVVGGKTYFTTKFDVADVMLRGEEVGGVATDLFYMVQYQDLATGEPLKKPKVTMVVPYFEKDRTLAPEYYIEDDGNLRVEWESVPDADAYAVVQYTRHPDKEVLKKEQEEYRKKALEFNKNAKDNESLILLPYEMTEGVGKDGYSLLDAKYVSTPQTHIAAVVKDRKFLSDHYALKGSLEEIFLKEETRTQNAYTFSVNQVPGSQQYLSVVALKEVNKGSKDVPKYVALKESSLYDFNDLARKMPSQVSKYEIQKDGKYTTMPIDVETMAEIPTHRYVQMMNGDYRKMDLRFTGKYRMTKERKYGDLKDMPEVLELDLKMPGTPFHFYYYVRKHDPKTLERDLSALKKRLEGPKFSKPSVFPEFQAPVVVVDRKTKTVKFVEGKPRFQDNAGRGKTSGNKNYSTPQPSFSTKATSGGLAAYTEEEKSACLPKDVYASTNMGDQIAWAMMTGQTPVILKYNVTSNRIRDCVREVNWQNQLILENDHVDMSITPLSGGGYQVDFRYLVSDLAERKRMQREMMAKGREIVSEILAKYPESPIDQIYAVNKYLVENAEYDTYVAENGVSNTPSRMAYGVLVNHLGVCTSYARAFQFLADMLNFGVYVDGGDVPGGKHAWNIVKTKGDDYMMVDVTWNDCEGYEHQYMMIPDRAARADHFTTQQKLLPEKFRSIHRPYADFSLDYLNETGRTCQVSELSAFLSFYIDKGYYPTWLRVTDLYENYLQVESQLNRLTKLGYISTWKYSYENSSNGIVEFELDDYQPLNQGYLEAYGSWNN